MANKLVVAPAPHVQTSQSTARIMRDVVIALMPALAVSAVVFGVDVLRVTALSVAACVLFEYLIQKFLVRGASTIGNWSAVVLDYCRISAKGVGTDFAAEDTVTLTGSAAEQAGQWNELDGDRIVYDAGTDALRVKADPGGEWFYGRLTRTGAAVRWVSLDLSLIHISEPTRH